MKEFFKKVNFRADRLVMVDHCNEIVERYQAQNLRLTLRQSMVGWRSGSTT
jgi:hypothetical protein